ncbi:putative protein N(5)-glutamine methyltransferase [Prauserella oleivorans]|uniref:peptide chain release factor N(5)-glutamine methyltransferase n=1 Tax=Prauserella oleivorans TaxID=1478153 RepID=A0ABW5WBN5_9PSEU
MTALPQPHVVARLRAAGCVFAEDEARVLTAAARTEAELAELVERRVAGLPLEHIVGWAEFRGLRIAVEPGVFVPRRRTEFVVELALAALPDTEPVVVDLCCGSGALGVAIATERPRARVHAVDIDPAAVRCARRNLAALGGRVYEGDLFRALPVRLRGRVDAVVANVPYVPSAAIASMPPEARLHEPAVALDGGPDGLDVLRRVAAGVGDWLSPGGRLFIETSERQAVPAAEAFAESGLLPRLERSEELGATVVIGRSEAAPDVT